MKHQCKNCDELFDLPDVSNKIRHIMANWDDDPERQELLDKLGSHATCPVCHYTNHIHHCTCFVRLRNDEHLPHTIEEDIAHFREMMRHAESCATAREEILRGGNVQYDPNVY